MNKTKIQVRGGCHCGAVVYEVMVISVEEFDGQNWERHAGALERLSKEN